jgi:hypothetical protein
LFSRIANKANINVLGERIIETYFPDESMGDFYKKVLQEKENIAYISIEGKHDEIELDTNTQLAVDKLSSTIENVFLFPQFVRTYVVLNSANMSANYIKLDPDSNTLYTDFFIRQYFPWSFSVENLASNNSTIILKYPLSNVIKIEVLPFTIPVYYYAYTSTEPDPIWPFFAPQRSPPNKKIQILISEIKEKYSTNRTENYTLPANIQWDEETYNGTDLPYISNVYPENNGLVNFRYVIEKLDTITFSFNDYLQTMLCAQNKYFSYYIFKGVNTVCKITGIDFERTHLLTDGTPVVVTDIVTTQPVLDAPYVAKLGRSDGWPVTVSPTSGYEITILCDTSGMPGTFRSFIIHVPSRILNIPVIITQLRVDTN